MTFKIGSKQFDVSWHVPFAKEKDENGQRTGARSINPLPLKIRSVVGDAASSQSPRPRSAAPPPSSSSEAAAATSSSAGQGAEVAEHSKVDSFSKRLHQAGQAMTHGTLEVANRRASQHGEMVRDAVYHPAHSMNIAGSDFDDVLPEQNKLEHDTVDAYRAELSMQPGSVPAISASLTSSGKLKIIDGHHRFAASLAAGVPVRMEVDEQRDIEFRKDWSSVAIVASDGSVKTG